MQRIFDTVADRRGNALVSAQVTIYTEDGSLATIFSDDGVTTVDNPIYTNADGEYTFFVQNGKFNTRVIASGYSTEQVNERVAFDPADALPSTGTAVANFNVQMSIDGSSQTAVPAGRMQVREITSTAYTFVTADPGWWVEVNLSTTATLTMTTASGYAIGDTTIIRQKGTGQVILQAGSGVTLSSSNTTKTAAQNSVIALTQVGTAVYSVYGDKATS